MIYKIKKIIRNNKNLVNNFFSLSILQITNILLPLITLPYLLRVIGFEKYGMIIFALSLINYFTTLTDFSFRITATRDVACWRDNKFKINLIYSKVIIIKSVFLLLSWAIIFIVVISFDSLRVNWVIYFLFSLMLLGYSLFPEWFFQGIEDMKYITYLNLGIKIFFTVGIFLFITEENDYWIYPLLQSCGHIGAGLFAQWLLIKKYKLKFIFLPWNIIWKNICNNTPIFINQAVPLLYNNTSYFLLGVFSTNSLLGIYQAISTIVNLIITILNILSRVFFPYLNKRKDEFIKYRNIAFIFASILILIVLLLKNLIFFYLNITYIYSDLILLILCVGIFGYAMNDIYGLNFFIVRQCDKLVMRNTIIASVIGFILSFPLIYLYSALGASMSISLSRLIMGCRLSLLYKRFNYENSST